MQTYVCIHAPYTHTCTTKYHQNVRYTQLALPLYSMKHQVIMRDLCWISCFCCFSVKSAVLFSEKCSFMKSAVLFSEKHSFMTPWKVQCFSMKSTTPWKWKAQSFSMKSEKKCSAFQWKAQHEKCTFQWKAQHCEKHFNAFQQNFMRFWVITKYRFFVYIRKTKNCYSCWILSLGWQLEHGPQLLPRSHSGGPSAVVENWPHFETFTTESISD